MKVPDKFPPGCNFVERSEGGFFVEFSDGRWFALDDDGELSPRTRMGSKGPVGEWFSRSEEDFFKELASLKAAAARNTDP